MKVCLHLCNLKNVKYEYYFIFFVSVRHEATSYDRMARPLRSPEIAIGLGRVRQLGKQGECLFRSGSFDGGWLII